LNCFLFRELPLFKKFRAGKIAVHGIGLENFMESVAHRIKKKKKKK